MFMYSTCSLFLVFHQWKIRRALAFSLHDLAKLIGPERTISDILPVFEDFLKDVEDVSACQLCVQFVLMMTVYI